MKQTVLIFGVLGASIFVLFELNKYSLWGSSASSDVFILVSGLSFITIGILIHHFLIVQKEHPVSKKSLRQSDLTKQEHKVLCLIADGLSNNEIAESLFISESTVKTHVSNIFSKLQARRRTEAVRIGRDLEII